jgi:hypothetical protein
MGRYGKIANLPRDLRDQLNRRLDDGEPGVRLVEWLNQLPEVQAVLARNFEGRKINEQNLTEWKAGGYRNWQARQEMLAQAREMAADAAELIQATRGKLTDHLAAILAARYAALVANWNGEAADEFRAKLRALRELCQDIVNLRRGDHSGARLFMEQERLKGEQEKTEEELFEQFEEWAKRPAVRDCLCANWHSPEERERRIREIFGRTSKEPDTPHGASDSNSDASDQTKSG